MNITDNGRPQHIKLKIGLWSRKYKPKIFSSVLYSRHLILLIFQYFQWENGRIMALFMSPICFVYVDYIVNYPKNIVMSFLIDGLEVFPE